MLVEYRTVAGEAKVCEIEKKSKFIAYICPVNTQEEAEAFVNRIRKQHTDASHNVPAYIVGFQGEIQKCSDDGEPSGSSGMPVLEVLKAHGLVNVAVVVTRYFGGVLLGRGGLIRAYSGACKSALVKAGVVRMIPQLSAEVTVDYSISGKVQNELIQSGITIKDTRYLADVTFVIQFFPKDKQALYEKVQEITADNFLWSFGEEVYFPKKVKID